MYVYKLLTITLKIFGGIFIPLHQVPPNNNSLYTALGERVLILTDGQFQQSQVYQCKKLLHKHQDGSSLLESKIVLNHITEYSLILMFFRSLITRKHMNMYSFIILYVIYNYDFSQKSLFLQITSGRFLETLSNTSIRLKGIKMPMKSSRNSVS